MFNSWKCKSITANNRRGFSLRAIMLWPETNFPNSSFQCCVLDHTLYLCFPYRMSPMSGCFSFCFSSRSFRYFPTRVAFPWRSSLSITSNTAKPIAHDTGLPPNWEKTTNPNHRLGPTSTRLHHKHSRPSYCVEILHPWCQEGLCHLIGGDHARHRVAIADGLPHGDNVRHKVLSLQLESPEVAANTAETNLDFISDENASCLAYISAKMSA